jgi:hypothetical protein
MKAKATTTKTKPHPIMNSYNNTKSDFSRGRLCVPVDGDIAEQEDQTVLCPEASSSKDYVNDSPGGGVVGRETPNLLNEHHETQTKLSHMAGSSVNTETETMRQTLGHNDTMLIRIKEIQTKKKEVWAGINKKLGVRIATLNMKGRNQNKKSKWPSLVTLLRKQRILVLGVQESHLDAEETEKIKLMCPKIEIINNGIHKNKEGIAFLINKELANNMTWKHEELITGRASRLTIKVEEERGLDIVLVYAPNNDNEKVNFFTELKGKIGREKELNNTIIMGDFNSVENELDRLPHHKDEEKVIESWKKVKRKYKLIDGWRSHNILNKGFTFIQPVTNSMSRIDRIYLNEDIYPYAYNWSHIDSAKISDHDLVTVDILRQKLPYIGKGLWRMNQSDIENSKIRELTDEILWRTEELMKITIKNETGNVQKIWLEAKEDIKEVVKNERKKKEKQLTKDKKNLKNKLEEKLKKINNDEEELREKYQKEIAELKEKITSKSRREIKKLQEETKARYKAKGEKYTKYWFKINKRKNDSQIILALQKKDGTLTNRTQEMMDIALEHHQELQKRPEMTEERKKAIEELKKTTSTKMPEEKRNELKEKTSYEEIKTSLRKAPNGSAPGTDGIIYEFYK